MDRPDFATAVVDPRKLTDYLLATGHPEGGAKAIFFRRYGFSPDAADGFAAALKAQAARCVDFRRDGIWCKVRRGWADPRSRWSRAANPHRLETLAGPPRFVTAYPLEGRRGAR